MLLMGYPSIRGEGFPDYAKDATWKILHACIYAHIQRLIDEYTGYLAQAITRFKYQCANMNVSDNRRYKRLLQQVVHKGGESKTNYIKRLKNIRLWQYMWLPTLRGIR